MHRVLVVDDAVVVRRMLARIVDSDPHLEAVGTAANGRIGLNKLRRCTPDAVVLDLEMPEMDGFEMLREIRAESPQLPVIVFSSLSQAGAADTIEALRLGANEFVAKPTAAGSAANGTEQIRAELLPKLKALCGVRDGARQYHGVALRRLAEPQQRRLDVIAVGASTGGPNALESLLRELPASLPVPVVIVQHMPPVFTDCLAKRLNQACSITVTEARDGEAMRPGHAYIAPGGRHLEVSGTRAEPCLGLTDAEPQQSCRPSVDVLFRSLTERFGSHVMTVMLTGMGTDGLAGTRELVAKGAECVVQDRRTSVVWGMPGAVARAGLAHAVLPLDEIASSVKRRVSERNQWSPPS